MRNLRRHYADFLYTCLVLTGAFLVNLLLKDLFETENMIPQIFVLGVFLVSCKTQGYLWGIAASMVSVLAVNYAFTYPFWAFDLISPECISSAVVMLIVAIVTSALTTKVMQQEKVKAEAETERMRGNLLRAVSHDLRTPLTSIYGACSAMIENFDDIPDQSKRKFLADMRSDAQWLIRMVENLLSVTRIDGKKVGIQKNDTVLEELIDTVLVKFHKHYPQQEVLLDLPAEFVSIPMDAMLIQQVLMNLLENAVFHARGMTHLWLKVEMLHGKAVFRVVDDGCGIPQDQLNGLFTGIQSTIQATDSGRSNMGIGLSVCSAIIRAHGSEIKVRSRLNQGTEFRFSLDLEAK